MENCCSKTFSLKFQGWEEPAAVNILGCRVPEECESYIADAIARCHNGVAAQRPTAREVYEWISKRRLSEADSGTGSEHASHVLSQVSPDYHFSSRFIAELWGGTTHTLHAAC